MARTGDTSVRFPLTPNHHLSRFAGIYRWPLFCSAGPAVSWRSPSSGRYGDCCPRRRLRWISCGRQRGQGRASQPVDALYKRWVCRSRWGSQACCTDKFDEFCLCATGVILCIFPWVNRSRDNRSLRLTSFHKPVGGDRRVVLFKAKCQTRRHGTPRPCYGPAVACV